MLSLKRQRNVQKQFLRLARKIFWTPGRADRAGTGRMASTSPPPARQDPVAPPVRPAAPIGSPGL